MRNEFMKIVLISSDLSAAVFLGIILAGYLLESREVVEKSKYYFYSLWVCLAGLILDALAYILDGMIESSIVVGLTNYLAYITIDILIACFTYYIKSRLSEKDPGYTTIVPAIVAVLCGIDALMLTFGATTGRLFRIENGVYFDGPWSDYIVVIPMICFIVIEVLIISKVKSLGIREVSVISLYIFMPGLAAILQAVNQDLELGYVGSAMGLVIIYVMIQSKVIAEEKVKAEMYSALSNIDVLTGLKNRRGYDEALGLVKKDEIIGTIFCDANSLKETNDKYGHEEGDKLIRRVSTLLNESFPDGEVCRISGDEFVVIVHNALKRKFAGRMNVLIDKIRSNGWIASVGYEIGIGEKVEELVKAAEEKMYEDKSNYYKQTGKERRR